MSSPRSHRSSRSATRTSIPVALVALLAVASASTPAWATAKKASTKKASSTKATTTTGAPATTTTTTAVPTTTVASPARGGTLVAAISQDPGQLNPAITTSGAVHSASELMYNGLVEIDENGKLIPELAESWTVKSGDYTFKLRKGVTWHDGHAFTAADVKYTFEDPLPKYHARARASLLDAVNRIETPDPQTVIFRFFKPYSAFLQQLNVTEAPILPAHLYSGTDAIRNPYNLKPVGTGPFEFDSYKPGAELRLKANKNYFKKGLPYLDGVVLRVIPDAGNQLIALEAGEVDFLYGVNGADLSRVKASKSLSTFGTLTRPFGDQPSAGGD